MDVCTAANEGNAYKYGVLGPAGTKELELAKVARWDEQNFSTIRQGRSVNHVSKFCVYAR